MLKIAQITDTHIDINDTKAEKASLHFEKVLDSVKQWKPDILVVTGDLAFPEGNKESYLYLKKHFDSLNIPCFITPGNHDDLGLMIEVFNEKGMPPVVITNGAVAQKGEILFFVDTANARIDIKQQNWLKRELEIHHNDPLIFTHYPPIPRGNSHMDKKYPFKTESLFKSCLPNNKTSRIFCGHYHREETINEKGIKVYLTPAASFYLANEEEFRLEEEKFGWRFIEINNKKINTETIYL